MAPAVLAVIMAPVSSQPTTVRKGYRRCQWQQQQCRDDDRAHSSPESPRIMIAQNLRNGARLAQRLASMAKSQRTAG